MTIIHKILKIVSALIMNKIQMLKNFELRYLVVGFMNTAFSYLLSLFLYYKLILYLNLIIISFITYLICITISFFTYKFFVFKSKGKCLIEYLRFFIGYGTISLLSIFCLWVLVNFFSIRFWIAQGCIAVIGISISFFWNKNSVFNVKQ